MLFEFKIRDRVEVLPLSAKGTVTALFVCEDGIQYRVRYFYDGNVRSEYFYSEELTGA